MNNVDPLGLYTVCAQWEVVDGHPVCALILPNVNYVTVDQLVWSDGEWIAAGNVTDPELGDYICNDEVCIQPFTLQGGYYVCDAGLQECVFVPAGESCPANDVGLPCAGFLVVIPDGVAECIGAISQEVAESFALKRAFPKGKAPPELGRADDIASGGQIVQGCRGVF